MNEVPDNSTKRHVLRAIAAVSDLAGILSGASAPNGVYQPTGAIDPKASARLMKADAEEGIVASLRDALEARAADLQVDLATLPGLKEAVEDLAQRMLNPNTGFMRQVTGEVAPADERPPTTFSALWYSGLSALDAAAIAVLRYIQSRAPNLATDLGAHTRQRRAH